MLSTRLLGHQPEYAVDDAMRALSYLDWTGVAGSPTVLTYFPVYRTNPFQEMLYANLGTVGIVGIPTYGVKRTGAVVDSLVDSDVNVVVHVHWLNQILAGAESEPQARRRAGRFLEKLYDLKSKGALLMWTVHNILEHDSRFPGVESELRSELSEASDCVHVMSKRTHELVSPFYQIDAEKTLYLPHPSYHDVYPSWMSRQQARQYLGIRPEARVYLLLGAMKPYKGVAEALTAFDLLSRAEPGRHVLLVAGNPSSEPEVLRFRDDSMGHPDVLAAFRRIPDAELQVFLRAADIAVFPYRRSLNSGAVALAETFSLPLIISKHSGEAAEVDTSYAITYDPGKPGGLLEAMQASQRLLSADAKCAAAAAATDAANGDIARMFAAQVRAMVDERLANQDREVQ